jgi:DNA-binding beta-propeller fold protein YncE
LIWRDASGREYLFGWRRHRKGYRITPDGSELEVGNSASSAVVAVNVNSGSISGTTAVPGSLYNVTVSADGQWVYAANYNSSTAQVIPPAASPIPVGADTLVLKVSANGEIAAALGAVNLSVINTSTQQVSGIVAYDLLEMSAANLQITGQISINSSSYLSGDIVITKDGSTAYVGTVTPPSQTAISVVDLTKGLVTATIALPGDFAPQGIALAPDERLLYATPGVWAIDVQQEKVIATLSSSGVTPWEVAVSPDSKLVYVTNSAGNAMLVITTPPNGVPQVSGTITLPGQSYGVAFGR